MESIGTRDFEWNLKNAIDEQEKPERKKKLLATLDEFAKKIKSTSDVKGQLSYEKNFHGFHAGDWKKPKDADKEEYYYIADNYSVSLYKKVGKSDVVKKELSPKEKAFNKREAELKKLSKMAYELRYTFVKEFSASKKYSAEIHAFAFKRLMRYGSADLDNILKMLNIEKPEGNEYNLEVQEKRRALVIEKYTSDPERAMLVVAYITFDDKPSNSYYQAMSWNGFKIQYQKNSNLDMIYDTLTHQAYRTMLTRTDESGLIFWEGQLITVDQANKVYLEYSAEGSEKAIEIQTMIAAAKSYIRELYPDN